MIKNTYLVKALRAFRIRTEGQFDMTFVLFWSSYFVLLGAGVMWVFGG